MWAFPMPTRGVSNADMESVDSDVVSGLGHGEQGTSGWSLCFDEVGDMKKQRNKQKKN